MSDSLGCETPADPINVIEETRRGPSFWKFNSSLLENEKYIKLITDKYSYWLEKGKVLQDPR